jgi:putative transposase
MEAYVHGVSTRKVDDLVGALGATSGISKSEVSRICTALDGEMAAFRGRPLANVEFAYVFLDATYVKGRVGGQVVGRAVVIATGESVNGDWRGAGLRGQRSEDEAVWSEFLRSPRTRGLFGVRLVISDHHLGLKEAISSVMLGALGYDARSLHAQRARPSAAPVRRDGCRRDPHNLRPTRRQRRHRTVRPHHHHPRRPVP